MISYLRPTLNDEVIGCRDKGAWTDLFLTFFTYITIIVTFIIKICPARILVIILSS
jgi:hypothetical protein